GTPDHRPRHQRQKVSGITRLDYGPVMPAPLQLRRIAREIFDESLRAVNAVEAVRCAIHLTAVRLRICDVEVDLRQRKICSIAIGKAAASMAVSLEDQLGSSFTGGVLAGPGAIRSRKVSTRWRRYEGGHPLPNERSLMAASEAFALLDRANKERALIIFLISGGGSAMIEWPVSENITLGNLRMANKTLINCGPSIAEINCVRCAFSAIKGGKLAARAPNCDQITLIISDVPKGQERNVASG